MIWCEIVRDESTCLFYTLIVHVRYSRAIFDTQYSNLYFVFWIGRCPMFCLMPFFYFVLLLVSIIFCLFILLAVYRRRLFVVHPNYFVRFCVVVFNAYMRELNLNCHCRFVRARCAVGPHHYLFYSNRNKLQRTSCHHYRQWDDATLHISPWAYMLPFSAVDCVWACLYDCRQHALSL